VFFFFDVEKILFKGPRKHDVLQIKNDSNSGVTNLEKKLGQ